MFGLPYPSVPCGNLTYTKVVAAEGRAFRRGHVIRSSERGVLEARSVQLEQRELIGRSWKQLGLLLC